MISDGDIQHGSLAINTESGILGHWQSFTGQILSHFVNQ